MKKSHHIDITKPNCSPDDINQDLQDFYNSLLKNQEKHSIIKIKNKAKVTKMISNICTMIQNNNNNVDPFLDQLSKILIFLVSPCIDDADIQNDSINCMFLLMSAFKTFDKDHLTPLMQALFTLSNELDKKQKSTKRFNVTSFFVRFIKQSKNEEDLDRKKIWFQTAFYCAFPILNQIKQLDPSIIPDCSYYCMESIIKIISRATENNMMDYFLKEDNLFFIFESVKLLKSLYKYSNDRKWAILFYSRIFPCIFYYIDLDLSAHKFEKKDDMNYILESRRYSGWGGPNLLTNFNSVPRPFFYKVIDLLLNSFEGNTFVILLEPMLEAMCSMLYQIKDSQDIATDIIDLYFIIMRLRNVIKLSYKSSTSMDIINSSFTCVIMYITQMNPSYKEYFPFFISFYLTTLFDAKFVNVNEARNFVKSIINLTNISESNKTNVIAQISVHVISLITIALSSFLLDIPKVQRKAFLTNTMEMKISLKPLSLTLMRRITATTTYFFMQIIGCDFTEIIDDMANFKNDLNTNDDGQAEYDEKSRIDCWTKENASDFILKLIEAIDPCVNYVASITVADILICILKETNNSNPDFIFGKIVPTILYNALNMNPNISVFLPVLRKIIRNAYRYGFLNNAMAHDWFRVVQKYILSKIHQDYKNELILGVAQSIIQGYPMALSMIPIFVVFINYIINPDSSLIDADSKEEISSIVFTKNISLFCTCLVDIIIIIRNNPIFSNRKPSPDPSFKDLLLKIFNGNQAYASSFETIVLSEGGLRKKCLLLLKHICSTINQADLKNLEKLILLLLFNELVQNNKAENEEINNIIEIILIDTFIKANKFISLSLEFYHLMALLLDYFNLVTEKFPNLLTEIIYSISMTFAEHKTITNDQYAFLLRFITNVAVTAQNNGFMYQCLNIISLPATDSDRNLILDKVFDKFVYSYKKKTGGVSLKFDDMILLNKIGTIYSLKFDHDDSNNKTNSMFVQISNECGSNNYSLKFQNKFQKERLSLTSSNASDNNTGPNKSKTNFKLFRDFILYPSTGLLFEFLSEASNSTIKGTCNDPNSISIAKKAFLRSQQSFIEPGIIFIGNNQNHKEEYLLNEWKDVSSTFCTFLTSIGTLYKPDEIPFLFDDSGKIHDNLVNDDAVLCWKDSLHKVIYNVSTLSNYDVNDRYIKNWNRFKEKKFLVFWSESTKQIDFFSEGFLSEGKLEYAFIVKPYYKDLAALTIFQKRSNLPVLGFFKKKFVLPFNLIGFVISSMLILTYDMNEQLHSLRSNEFKQHKDLYKNTLDDDSILFQ